MIITRRLRFRHTWPLVARSVGLGALWATVIFVAYSYFGMKFLRIPFLPLSTIGTAVAFYVGLKNSSSYDRFWEGRKIWGAVVNVSRTFAVVVLQTVEPNAEKDASELKAVQQRLIYRHLAWINALRMQLRATSRLTDKPSPSTRHRLEAHATAMRMDWHQELTPFLKKSELEEVTQKKNAATHLVAKQGEEVTALQRAGRINIFHHTKLLDLLEELYTLQGKSERIKNTPFPRQYAEFSRLFTWVFCFFVPLGLLDVFGDHHPNFDSLQSWGPVLPMIVASAMISWVFMTLEGVGDASEDPFERSMNDVPLNALCRTIEIDLRELLGETDLPPKEPPAEINGFQIMY